MFHLVLYVKSSANCWYRAHIRAAAALSHSRRLRSSHTRPRVPRALTDEVPRTRPRRCLSRDPVRGPRSTGRPARRVRARRVMRPLEESEIQQVFEKLFKFVGKNLKNIVDRADQPHCFRLHKKVRRARVQPPRPPRVARFAQEASEQAAWKKTHTHSAIGSRTFFSRARRSFPERSAPSAPSPPRPSPTGTRASQTAVMRKYPRFRTASVDEAQTISWLNFFG